MTGCQALAANPESSPDGGCLYVVATPIGNRGDFSPRARETMLTCDLIAAEDTRALRKLIPGEELRAEVIASHEHNEKETAARIADTVEAGGRVALVSEAGTPAVSDPGFRAVRECRKRGLKVVTVPGPSAVIAALSISGLPSDRFAFVGFLAPKSAARIKFFEEQKGREETLILYESTHRIEKFLNDLIDTLGPERTICVTRELTKLHESTLAGPAVEVRDRLLAGSTKGEFVVLIAREGFTL